MVTLRQLAIKTLNFSDDKCGGFNQVSPSICRFETVVIPVCWPIVFGLQLDMRRSASPVPSNTDTVCAPARRFYSPVGRFGSVAGLYDRLSCLAAGTPAYPPEPQPFFSEKLGSVALIVLMRSMEVSPMLASPYGPQYRL
jgi:hypothetical protein